MVKRRKLDSDCSAGKSSYQIGYGKPPTDSRFKPGQSGNPAGRRKGLRNLKSDVVSMLAVSVKVKEGGRTRMKSTQEGALMVLREKALLADARALERVVDLASRFNNDEAEAGLAQPLSTDDQAILDDYVAKRVAAATSQESANHPLDRPVARRRIKAPE